MVTTSRKTSAVVAPGRRVTKGQVQTVLVPAKKQKNWKKVELSALRAAFFGVSTSATNFWDLVAKNLGSGRSPDECRERWFAELSKKKSVKLKPCQKKKKEKISGKRKKEDSLTTTSITCETDKSKKRQKLIKEGTSGFRRNIRKMAAEQTDGHVDDVFASLHSEKEGANSVAYIPAGIDLSCPVLSPLKEISDAKTSKADSRNVVKVADGNASDEEHDISLLDEKVCHSKHDTYILKNVGRLNPKRRRLKAAVKTENNGCFRGSQIGSPILADAGKFGEGAEIKGRLTPRGTLRLVARNDDSSDEENEFFAVYV